MISRSKAEAALTTLAIARSPDNVTAHEVSGAFRAMAAVAHPDKGGTAEQMHALTDARQVLDNWVKQRGAAAEHDITDGLCKQCGGTGYRKVTHGFKTTRRACQACRGTGDMNYEHERGGD